VTARWLLQSGLEQLLDGDIFQALIAPYVDLMGIPLTALLVFGSVGVSYYAVSGRVVMPVIMMILVGGVTMSFAPPSAARFGVVVLILGVASIGYLAWRRARGR